jgi:hypothetical protein
MLENTNKILHIIADMQFFFFFYNCSVFYKEKQGTELSWIDQMEIQKNEIKLIQ